MLDHRECIRGTQDAFRVLGGKTLRESLRRRATVREISDKPLSDQMLSNVLWAACGNRKKGPFGEAGLTAASAGNSQEIDLYVALSDGAFRFDPIHHRLVIAANVYLFAASQGLAAWFHNCDRATLSRELGFQPKRGVLFAQSVGYPQASR